MYTKSIYHAFLDSLVNLGISFKDKVQNTILPTLIILTEQCWVNMLQSKSLDKQICLQCDQKDLQNKVKALNGQYNNYMTTSSNTNTL